VSRRLWKTQGGVYGGELKSKEYAKLSLRERVELRLKQDEEEEQARRKAMTVNGQGIFNQVPIAPMKIEDNPNNGDRTVPVLADNTDRKLVEGAKHTGLKPEDGGELSSINPKGASKFHQG